MVAKKPNTAGENGSKLDQPLSYRDTVRLGSLVAALVLAGWGAAKAYTMAQADNKIATVSTTEKLVALEKKHDAELKLMKHEHDSDIKIQRLTHKKDREQDMQVQEAMVDSLKLIQSDVAEIKRATNDGD